MKKGSWKLALSAAVLSLIFLALSIAPALAVPLPGTTIPKYTTPLFIPPAMPSAGTVNAGAIDYYEIAVQQFQQQVLPTGFPQTTLWSYGAVNSPASLHYPAYTIEADVNRPVRVKWINDLKNPDGTFLPHLFAAEVDQQLHWANPPQLCLDGTTRPDCEGTSNDPYTGPVPIITHLHGAHVAPESDGFPEAWYLPAASDIPAGYATQGSDFGQFAGMPVQAGAAVFQYRNDQRATTLWYHDHTLGLTRLNVYAGPVGFYLLRGGTSDLPTGVLPSGAYEIPLVLQDKSFNTDGTLLFAGGQGDTMVVNGNTWPVLNVEQRRYRFRFLNAANDNFQTLALATDDNGVAGIDDGQYTLLTDAIVQIGADGGFLPAPVARTEMELAIAERIDAIVDFSGFAAGTEIYLVNTDGDPGTTDQVMKFIVGPAASQDTTTPADQLILPTFTPLGLPYLTRQVSLNDDPVTGKRLLGTVAAGVGVPLRWEDAITESPLLDSIEIWEITNFEGSPHPIHLHQVQFEILGRGPDGVTPPGPGETGTKDTVIVGDGETVRVKARFDIPGQYVWHCHILDHEDDEMMRPFEVVTQSLQIISPNAAGTVLPAGGQFTITWGAPLAATLFKLHYSLDNGATWILIANNVTGNSYNWTVPTFFRNRNNVLLRVTAFAANNTSLGSDISIPFAIEVVKLNFPNGGENLAGGSLQTITWTTNGTRRPVARVGLAFTRNGGVTWELIKSLASNPGTYNWTVPTPLVTRNKCKVRVTLRAEDGTILGRDASDAFFTVAP